MADAPQAPPERWTADDIVAVLTRRPPRGLSRYDGPRLPLRFGFRPGDATLGKAAKVQLREVAQALKTARLAGVRIRIEGYTDDVEAEPEAERIALGLRRAEAVREKLIRSGIARGRLPVKSLGSLYPLSPNTTLAGRDANRRVELFNLDEGSPVWRDVRKGR